jgi:hypothetical protein
MATPRDPDPPGTPAEAARLPVVPDRAYASPALACLDRRGRHASPARQIAVGHPMTDPRAEADLIATRLAALERAVRDLAAEVRALGAALRTGHGPSLRPASALPSRGALIEARDGLLARLRERGVRP